MSNLTKAAIWVFLINVIAKVLGLLKESVLAYKFGTSSIVDAYTIAITFPTIIFAIIAGGINEAFVPVITRIEGEEKKNNFVNDLIIIMSCVSVAMIIICMMFNDQIVDILAPGFTGESRNLSESFVFLISILIFPMAIFHVMTGLLNSEENFVIVNVCNLIIANLVIIISIFLADRKHSYILIIGYIMSYVVPLLVSWIYAKRKTYFKFKFSIDIKSDQIRELLKLAIPLGVSLIVNQINAMVSRALASTLGAGVVAALSYANKVQLVFYSLVASVMISVCFPRINRCFAKNEYNAGMQYIAKGFMIATLIGVPTAVILFIFAEPITNLIFERGSFDNESTYITAGCLAFYAIGIPFYSYREILLRGLSANKKQKLILKNTIIAIAFNVLLSFILMEPLGHVGLALATSLAGIIASVLMYYDLRKLKLELFDRDMLTDILKICICTVMIVIIGVIVYNYFGYAISETVALIISAAIMVILYLVGIVIFRVKIFKWMLNSILSSR